MTMIRHLVLATLTMGLATGAICGDQCPDEDSMMKRYTMVTLRPPSMLNGPGAVVRVHHRENYIEVSNLCGVRASLGSGFVPLESPTNREEISRSMEHRFRVGANLLSQLQLETEFEWVQSISVSFKNPRIMQVSVADVIANRVHRSWECKEAIRYYLAAGHDVSMITTTLEGELVYTVQWKAGYNIDVTATVEVVSNLAARLGFGQAICTTHTISSETLIWGLRDDIFLMQLSMDSGGPMLRRSSKSIIDPAGPIHIPDVPVAPVVISTNPDNAHYKPAPNATTPIPSSGGIRD